MASLNDYKGLGNLGDDPRCGKTQQGVSYAFITIAMTETYMKNGEKQTVTNWANIQYYRKTAEYIQKYLKKGDRVYVEAKCDYGAAKTTDGHDMYANRLIGKRILNLSHKPK